MTRAVATTSFVPSPAEPWNVLQLGTIVSKEDQVQLRITAKTLETHLGIFGGTRYGKSKLFELLCRELIAMSRGFAFIDPHSDTADDLFAFLASQFPRLGWLRNNIHYLNPNERLFSFDPFAYHPEPDEPLGTSDFRYRAWLHTTIKDVVNIIVRQQGETEDEKQKMVRLKRWLYNALYAVGVRQDQHGTHLPLKDALSLLNPADPRHEELYTRVEPFLSSEVRSDFEKLRATRDARKQEDWVESTFNRLRDILSPIVERIFNLEAPSIDFRAIIRRGGVILAALGKTPHFHEDEALAIAGLLIREISEAARTVARDRRKQYFLLIDEAQAFLGEDLLRILKESAKYKLALGLAVQGLDNLQKGSMDLVPAVLGQCGIRITFRQQYYEHAETLAKSFCYPMLDFAELIHKHDVDDGYEWVLAPSVSVGEGTSQTSEVGHSRSRSHGTAVQTGLTASRQQSTSLGKSLTLGHTEGRSRQYGGGRSVAHGVTDGVSSQETENMSRDHSESLGTTSSMSESRQETLGHGESQSVSRSPSGHGSRESRAVSQSHSLGMTSSHGSSESRSLSTRESHGRSASVGENHSRSKTNTRSSTWGRGRSASDSVALGATLTHGESKGISRSASTSHNTTEGEGNSTSEGTSQSANRSVTLQCTPLHRTRVEQQQTGRLEHAVADQFAAFAAEISSLSKQHCLVAIAALNRAFVLRVDDVVDPFERRGVSEAWRMRTIAQLKQRIFAMHPYYFAASEPQPALPTPPLNGASNGKPHATPRLRFADPSPFPG